MRQHASRRASKVGDAVGRWFGVTDADGMEQARAQYVVSFDVVVAAVDAAVAIGVVVCDVGVAG
jgi:hypothetical protein